MQRRRALTRDNVIDGALYGPLHIRQIIVCWNQEIPLKSAIFAKISLVPQDSNLD
jgi:hypothetical protein